ncbi:phosphotransferase enzyme family protein [Roseivirga sp.]|uniref:phosphotransferase enzyme family protein n=1 Tax=Roseivirga sp. TaxID=1964215 RepID=UPI003B8DBD48
MEAVKKALQAFNIKGAVDQIALFGSGHINDTYRVSVGEEEYLLQRLNEKVFTNTTGIENNLALLLKENSSLFVKHFKSKEDTFHYKNEDGVWRLTTFHADDYSPQTAGNLVEVAESAKGYGAFIAFTNDFELNLFQEIIPRFHELEWRLKQFDNALRNDLANRSLEVKEFVSQVNNHRAIGAKMNSLLVDGLPTRLCHNDTKLNNSLLAKSDSTFQKIIDLDTLGPGTVLYDFGDLMRTTLSNTDENELEASKIRVRPEYYETLKENFLSTSSAVLSQLEIENLFFGGQYMTYMMAVRFLTDYINGDIYYKTSFENENLVRSQNQLTLLELINAYEREIG